MCSSDLVKVSRTEYRRRFEEHYLEQIRRRYAPCLLIPEGGANAQGVRGCMAIAELVESAAPGYRRLFVAVGTGTTLAGVIAGLDSTYDITGISGLRGATDLEARVAGALTSLGIEAVARWQIVHDAHCGGFARIDAGLREFMLAFEQVQGIALEPVYTGKLLYAIHQRLLSGEWRGDDPLLAIHSGGLQGRRGYSWLSQ